jgi:hypothetical protein
MGGGLDGCYCFFFPGYLTDLMTDLHPFIKSDPHMPRIVAEIPQTFENIIRPVSLEVARQIAKMLNLPADISVLLPGESETTLYPNTELGASTTADPSSFGHDQRMLLEVLEAPVEDRILSTAIHQKENLPFFLDKALGVRMYPVYSGTELSFNITYRANSRTNARKFRNEMLTRTAAMREEILHELNYYYHVPYVFLHLLKHIHTLRERVSGYGHSWDKYVQDHITDAATTITDQIGENQALVIREFQTNPLGTFQFVGTTDPEQKDKESGTFNITFQYKFVFDQIISAVAEWPLLIHNQLIEEPWRSQPWASGELVDPNRRKRRPSSSRYAFDYFTNVYTNPCKVQLMDGVVIPNFDEWRPMFVTPNTSTLLVGMMALDPTTPNILFDLMDDLDGYFIDPSLRQFILNEAPFINIKGASIFDLRLYEGDLPMDDQMLSLSVPDLTVLSNAVMDLRKVYHVRLALVNDLFTLNLAAWERLRAGGPAAIKILNCLQFKLLGKAFEPKLLGGYLISNADLTTIAQRINDLKVPHKGPLEHVMLTVNEIVVVAHRSSDNVTSQKRTFGPTDDGSDPSKDPFTKPADCSS